MKSSISLRSMSPSCKNNLLLAALCWLLAFVLMFCFSRDSYIFDVWWRQDSNWFMTCGRAWMNGMTPYVDFCDSKGPLLWLIYGLGYLISPKSYVGVMWISSITYAVVFFFSYKILRLLGASRLLRMAALMVLGWLMLNGFVHDDVRAEDFCQAFFAPVLYRFVLHDTRHNLTARQVAWSAVALGVCLAGTLLIKYSVTLMLMAFVPHFCYVFPRKAGLSPLKAFLLMAGAAVVVLLPWVVVMLAQGWFKPFIEEYFLKTLTTLNNLGETKLSQESVVNVVFRKSLILYTLFIAAMVVLYCRKYRKWWLMVAMVWTTIVVLLNGKSFVYYSSLALFAAPGLAILFSTFQHKSWARSAAFSITLIAFFLIGITNQSRSSSFFTHDLAKRDRFYYYGGLMSQVEHPRILFWDMHDKGQGLPAEALPACPYWALQEGATDEMRLDQDKAAREKRCDFVLIDHADTTHARQLEQWGYYRYDYWDRRDPHKHLSIDGHDVLYSTRPLHDTLVHVSNLDVLLKRPIHFPK